MILILSFRLDYIYGAQNYCSGYQTAYTNFLLYSKYGYARLEKFSYSEQLNYFSRPHMITNQSVCYNGNFGVNFTKVLGYCYEFNTDQDAFDRDT